MKNFRFVFGHIPIYLVVMCSSGCSSLYDPEPAVISLSDDQFVSRTASIRLTDITRRGSSHFICSEPPPDAAFSQKDKSDFSITLVNFGGGDDKADNAEETAEVELSGRTPAVLASRELLYRLCEFSRNHALGKEAAMELYRVNLSIIEKILVTEGQNTRVEVKDTSTISVNETENRKMVPSPNDGNAAQTMTGAPPASNTVPSSPGGASLNSSADPYYSPETKR